MTCLTGTSVSRRDLATHNRTTGDNRQHKMRRQNVDKQREDARGGGFHLHRGKLHVGEETDNWGINHKSHNKRATDKRAKGRGDRPVRSDHTKDKTQQEHEGREKKKRRKAKNMGVGHWHFLYRKLDKFPIPRLKRNREKGRIPGLHTHTHTHDQLPISTRES